MNQNPVETLRQYRYTAKEVPDTSGTGTVIQVWGNEIPPETPRDFPTWDEALKELIPASSIQSTPDIAMQGSGKIHPRYIASPVNHIHFIGSAITGISAEIASRDKGQYLRELLMVSGGDAQVKQHIDSISSNNITTVHSAYVKTMEDAKHIANILHNVLGIQYAPRTAAASPVYVELIHVPKGS